jgi:hypothetical protein
MARPDVHRTMFLHGPDVYLIAIGQEPGAEG